MLQTCGLGRVSSDTSKNFRFEVQTCSWKTVIGASCPPAPHSYRCHIILTEPRGSANQINGFVLNVLHLAVVTWPVCAGVFEGHSGTAFVVPKPGIFVVLEHGAGAVGETG